MNEYNCMKCIYGSLSVDDFPCDVCYAGDMYDPGGRELGRMSVFVKGMRMPENCIKCPMQFGGMCYVMPAEVDESRVAPTVEAAWKQGKPDWCPISEIHEPHGDLIDRDALISQMESDTEQMEEPIAKMFAYAAISDVKHAQIILEAEGSEGE